MQAIHVRFPGGETTNFYNVEPLSKSKGGETEELILLFGWLGVFYLLARGCQWHGEKFCMAS